MSDETEPIASTERISDIALYPWALRVLRFDDQGLEPAQRKRYEAELGRPLDPLSDECWQPPRSEWADGPWQTEPDLVEWREDGIPYPLMIIRGRQGAWCGYVGLPPGHPLHGDGALGDHPSGLVTEALTWSSECGELLTPTGEPPDCWWLGFDCAHVFQYSPCMAALSMKWTQVAPGVCAPLGGGMFSPDHYVPLMEVKDKTEQLARELLDIAKRTDQEGET